MTTTNNKRSVSNASDVNLKTTQLPLYTSKFNENTYIGCSIPENNRFVKYSRLTGFIQSITKIKGKTKLIFNSNCNSFFSLQYFNESQCIRAIRKPGNVKMAPIIPHKTAMKNLTTIFDAGPLWILKENTRKNGLNENHCNWF